MQWFSYPPIFCKEIFLMVILLIQNIPLFAPIDCKLIFGPTSESSNVSYTEDTLQVLYFLMQLFWEES